MKLVDLTGVRFGELSVIKKADKPNRIIKWGCRCDCGNVTFVQGGNLKNGHTTSCGCAAKKKTIERSTKHGCARRGNHTKAYKAWRSMNRRCTDPNDKRFKDYGGRGISVCERWANSFNDFLFDMGEPPSTKHSLDRFPNNDGDYELNNCRWATSEEQANNKRNNWRLVIGGRTLSIKEAAAENNLNYGTLLARKNKLGYSDEMAITKPLWTKTF